MIVCYFVAAITPPFQAPDEFDHIKRAYMLGKGQMLLHSEAGSPSGGMVDSGLVEYMGRFSTLPAKAGRKVSDDELKNAGDIHWAGTDTFETPVGTSYYFPALYAPQAIGLMTGKALGASLSQSYRLARFLTLFTCFALIFLAWRIFPPPPVMLAVLALPMNIFLLASPSLDGMTTATAIVALAAFMRISTDRVTTPTWVLYTFAIALGLVVACRANAAPFLILPFAVWWMLRDRRSLVMAAVVAVAVMAWTLYTVKFTVYPPGPRHIDHLARLLSYVLHPGRFASILYSTLSNGPVLSYYGTSFIGVLGWLDTPFNMGTYYVMTALLVIALLFSLSPDTLSEQRLSRGLLVLCAIGMLLMTYLAMLVQWTIGDPDIIQGVQGRYFMIPVIALAFALCGEARPRAGLPNRVAMFAAAALLAFTTYAMAQTLVYRYYMAASQPTASFQPVLKATPSVQPNAAIPIVLSPAQTNEPAALDRIDIMFGTYARAHPGGAVLRMTTNSGETLAIPFELSSLVDNGYRRFDLDGKRYVRGQIVSDGGEGVSVWDSRIGDSLEMTCAITHTHDGQVVRTIGCPAP
jgi:uncharacterized membrane protein